jgi:hypothetical protein
MAQYSSSSSVEGCNQGPPASTTNNPVTNVYMLKGDTHIVTRAQDYGMSKSAKKGKEATNPSVPLQIENIMGEIMTCISKCVFKKCSHNLNTRAAQNYFVVENLAQATCAMFALEVLQIFPSQRKDLLSSMGSSETCNTGVIILDLTDLEPFLPYHIAFQIVVAYTTKSFTQNIFYTVVDEGASTFMMSLVCWKVVGQPILYPSPTFLTAFDGRSFKPHGIIPSFPV